MQHPLAAVVDRIDPDARYRIPDLAELLGLAVSSAGTLGLSGWFPGGSRVSLPHGGGYWVWTGRALIDAADTDPPALDHDRYSPSTLWRLGCSCDDCLAWHNADTRERRRAAVEAAFTQEQRSRMLEMMAAGDVATVTEAAAEVGVSGGQVYGLARRDAEFRAALEAAGMGLCRGGDQCGRPIGYRKGCRGTLCRRAHRPLPGQGQ
jgi:hypothetical protein